MFVFLHAVLIAEHYIMQLIYNTGQSPENDNRKYMYE